MKPELNHLYEGDCLSVMQAWPANFVDTVITDPPYGLSNEPDMAEVLGHWLAGDDYQHRGGGFMGKAWDSFVPGPAVWREVYRVMKPGGTLMAFGGTRTIDLLSIAIRLAGFRKFDEISYHHGGLPGQIDWLYGSGFPKSYNIAKGVEGKLTTGSANWNEWRNLDGDDKPGHLGYTKTQAEHGYRPDDYTGNGRNFDLQPATPEGQAWDGWGTALKPGHEIILCFYKPTDGGYVDNALKWGVAGLWIDGSRVGDGTGETKTVKYPNIYNQGHRSYTDAGTVEYNVTNNGRWPANIITDGSPEIVAQFPVTTSGAGAIKKESGNGYRPNAYGAESLPASTPMVEYGDTGSAARFFYVAKPSRAERDAGLENLPVRTKIYNGKSAESSADIKDVEERFTTEGRNFHTTVKPLALLEYLCRLTKTPSGGVVLDPFAGSGTTAMAAIATQRDWLAIEKEPEYAALARTRIANHTPQLSLFD